MNDRYFMKEFMKADDYIFFIFKYISFIINQKNDVKNVI